MTRSELLERAKPILFNTEMVRAIQDGTKTVTRRVIKPKFTNTEIVIKNGKAFETAGTLATTTEIKSRYQAGDIFYVRETWAKISDWVDIDPDVGLPDGFIYKADWVNKAEAPKWHPSIHMPKEAARIFLRVINVTPQRLKEITKEHAKAEGFASRFEFITTFLRMYPNCTENDWVWVIELERME